MKLLAALVMLLALSACSLPVFFRVPVVQGNIVTADQVSKLKEGMTKKQVAYVLGTPLIKAPFETDRWDYVFYYRNPRAHVRQSKLDLYFVDDKLSDIEGNEEYTAQAMPSDNQIDSAVQDQLPDGNSSLGTGNSQIHPGNAPGNSSGAGQTSSGDNAPGSNRTVTPENQPTTEDPLPHKGPALPGQPN